MRSIRGTFSWNNPASNPLKDLQEAAKEFAPPPGVPIFIPSGRRSGKQALIKQLNEAILKGRITTDPGPVRIKLPKPKQEEPGYVKLTRPRHRR